MCEVLYHVIIFVSLGSIGFNKNLLIAVMHVPSMCGFVLSFKYTKEITVLYFSTRGFSSHANLFGNCDKFPGLK